MTDPVSYQLDLGEKDRIVVTGGGGFIGGALVTRLRGLGLQVTSFSREHYPRLDALSVRQIRGDVADGGRLGQAFEGCTLVFHVAAKAGIWGRYVDFHETNVIGTRNVLQACHDEGIRRLVYTSSPSVVFAGEDMTGADESVPYARHFKAAYPETKAIAEKMVLGAANERLATVALRPHLVWGPGDSHIIPGLLRRAREGQLRRIGRQEKKVDFTYIDNAVHAHLLAAQRLAPASPISGRSFFITDDRPVSLWGFINRLLETAGLPPVTRSVHPGVAYAAAWLVESVYRGLGLRSEPRLTRFLVEEMATAHWFDISAARRELGYRPLVDLETGMERVKAWLAQDESNTGPGV